MQTSSISEARRQVEICNACRYCEGYCAVFPAINRRRVFSDGDVIQLANLCHNCRACYYACQYTPPHEFAINLPKILAETRQQSWQDFAWPQAFGKVFQRHFMAVVAVIMFAFIVVFSLMQMLKPESSNGFYAYASHALLISIFLPAFFLPLMSQAIGLVKYWRAVEGTAIKLSDVSTAIRAAADMRNLSGGHGQGCNFEDADRYSNLRRTMHQIAVSGFLLCFLATVAATVMHYGFNLPAPYGLFSLPKLFGLTGGVLLCVGTAALAWLKCQADRSLDDAAVWSAEFGFIVVLGLTGLSGMLLYFTGDTIAMPFLLASHLGLVLAFFLLMPFTKMAHGFYRFAALCKDAQIKRLTR
jgi:citrate/tricarballylate utilization protein